MWTAAIVICGQMAMGLPPKCFRLQDNRGPYSTSMACERRLKEMAGSLGPAFKDSGYINVEVMARKCSGPRTQAL